MLNREQVIEKMNGNLHCSQIVLGALSEYLGYEQDELYRLSCPFGGGMGLGDTCGCVTGALMAIGIKAGNDTPGNQEQDQLCRDMAKRFQDEFVKQHGSTLCRELVGYDFRDPEQRRIAKEQGKTREICPQLILDAIAIAKKIILED